MIEFKHLVPVLQLTLFACNCYDVTKQYKVVMQS